MGVLAVGLGKAEAALPFLKAALEANPKAAQFWLSYINALITLNRLDDARAVFDQAKSKGAKGKGFDQIESRLGSVTIIEGDQANEAILQKAIELRENGKYDEAIDLLKNRIDKFPEDPNLPAILSHCFILKDNLKDAVIYLEKAKNLDPNIASVGWNETRLLLKQMKQDEALKVAEKTNKLFPNDVEGIGVLGICLRATGNLDESLKYLNKAVELNPNYAEAIINRALINIAKEDKVRALSDLETAHHLKPHLKQIWDLLIGLIVETKNYSKAIDLLIKMIEVDPSHEKSFSLLTACNQEADDPTLAIKSFEQLLKFKPSDATNYFNLGIALKRQGKNEKAIEHFEKALAIKPDFSEAYYNMGAALQEQDRLEKAIEAYSKAISIKPDYAEAYNNISIALKGTIFTKPNRDLQKTIVSLLDQETYVRPNYITIAALSLLKLEPDLQKHLQLVRSGGIIDSPLDVISDLSDLPLLLKLMSVCPLSDLDLERLLTNLRFAILSNVSSLKEASPEFIEFQSALALQCFTNEYIYSDTGEEARMLKSLDASVKKALENNNQPSPQAILALASYKALKEYDWCNLLFATDHIQEVFTRQVEEPNEEEKLKQDLPILQEITDSTSSEVRAQYEESPYPRWVNLGLALKPMSISEVVDLINLKLYDYKIYEVEKPEILIAGCGTGQHSIGTASRFKGSNVLAIDLSLSSMAYAKRKTLEFASENIEYMQADILDLGKLNKQFDIIESSGVLHHMDNPMAGWKVLADCLKPGGLMRIGLYSELARKHIVEIRNEISELGIGSSDMEMKSFRDMIIKSDKDHHNEVRGSSDFYSLSTLKDLLFHVQEHRFAIPQIKDYLTKLGLKFCGFETSKKVSNFKQINTHKDDPYNLDKWQTYEEANPRAFAGMYQFWCQKVD